MKKKEEQFVFLFGLISIHLKQIVVVVVVLLETFPQMELYGFRWIQKDTGLNCNTEIPSLLADPHEFPSIENGEKVGIVTGVDGIGGLIRRSCHPDPPIATILTPSTEPPAGREAVSELPPTTLWLLQIGTSFTQIIKISGQRV